MMTKVGGLACSIAALIFLASGGCGSNPPPCATIGGQVTLDPPQSALALTKNVVLIRAGDGFVLAGLDGATVRWGQLGSTGEITQESAFVLPEQPATTAGGQALGPVFAVTQKTMPGDQLVAVVGVLAAGTTDHYEMHAYIHDLGSVAAPSMKVLGEQAAAATSGTLRLVAGSSPNGTGALVLWGVEGQLAPINYQMLGADGALVGQASKLLDDPDPNNIPLWSCVDTTQNGSVLAVTVLFPSDQNHAQRWHRFSISDDGSVGGEAEIELTAAEVSDCRVVSTPGSDGDLVGYQSNANVGGTFFAEMFLAAPDAGPNAINEVTNKKVLPAEVFGGYSGMPKLAWIAPAGYEFTIGLARPSGPEVVRYDLFADPVGKALYLPSVSGHTGPVSAWVGPGPDPFPVYVTYLDMGGSAPAGDAAVPQGSKRLLVTVFPANLP